MSKVKGYITNPAKQRNKSQNSKGIINDFRRYKYETWSNYKQRLDDLHAHAEDRINTLDTEIKNAPNTKIESKLKKEKN